MMDGNNNYDYDYDRFDNGQYMGDRGKMPGEGGWTALGILLIVSFCCCAGIWGLAAGIIILVTVSSMKKAWRSGEDKVYEALKRGLKKNLVVLAILWVVTIVIVFITYFLIGSTVISIVDNLEVTTDIEAESNTGVEGDYDIYNEGDTYDGVYDEPNTDNSAGGESLEKIPDSEADTLEELPDGGPSTLDEIPEYEEYNDTSGYDPDWWSQEDIENALEQYPEYYDEETGDWNFSTDGAQTFEITGDDIINQ